MAKKRINITLSESDHKMAKRISIKQYGDENVSRLIGDLIRNNLPKKR